MMVDRGDRGTVVDKGSQSEGELSRMLFTGSNKRGGESRILRVDNTQILPPPLVDTT